MDHRAGVGRSLPRCSSRTEWDASTPKSMVGVKGGREGGEGRRACNDGEREAGKADVAERVTAAGPDEQRPVKWQRKRCSTLATGSASAAQTLQHLGHRICIGSANAAAPWPQDLHRLQAVQWARLRAVGGRCRKEDQRGWDAGREHLSVWTSWTCGWTCEHAQPTWSHLRRLSRLHTSCWASADALIEPLAAGRLLCCRSGFSDCAVRRRGV
eukprot:363771-Chlamydomonas_euryale.AAC.5